MTKKSVFKTCESILNSSNIYCPLFVLASFYGPKNNSDLEDLKKNNIALILPTRDRLKMRRYDGRKNSPTLRKGSIIYKYSNMTIEIRD